MNKDAQSTKQKIQGIIYMNSGDKNQIKITWIEAGKITDKILRLLCDKVDERVKTCYDDFEIGMCVWFKEMLNKND